MSEIGLYDSGAPHIEVRVYEQDRLIARELCESDADADAVVDRWSQDGDFTFQVDDLSHGHGPDDVLGGEAVEPDEGERDAVEPTHPNVLPG
jgi:hypothetical protein